MDATTTPDTTSYRLVHRALRTSARRLAEVTDGYDRQDPRRTRALVRWCEGFVAEIHCHHTIEDDAMFPGLVAQAPETAALIERTDADHAAMDRIMGRLEYGVKQLAMGGSPNRLHDAALDLADLLDDHLAFEDQHVIPAFEQHFTAEEYAALDAKALEILGVSKQALFTVPFILSHANPMEYAHLWKTAPLPFKLLQLASRGRYRRLTERALGTGSRPILEVVPERQLDAVA
ncbi:MAG: hemerythrin domain-containing protein [Aquihabitans sp.]